MPLLIFPLLLLAIVVVALLVFACQTLGSIVEISGRVGTNLSGFVNSLVTSTSISKKRAGKIASLSGAVFFISLVGTFLSYPYYGPPSREIVVVMVSSLISFYFFSKLWTVSYDKFGETYEEQIEVSEGFYNSSMTLGAGESMTKLIRSHEETVRAAISLQQALREKEFERHMRLDQASQIQRQLEIAKRLYLESISKTDADIEANMRAKALGISRTIYDAKRIAELTGIGFQHALEIVKMQESHKLEIDREAQLKELGFTYMERFEEHKEGRRNRRVEKVESEEQSEQ